MKFEDAIDDVECKKIQQSAVIKYKNILDKQTRNEIMQEALFMACKKFQPEKNVKFFTWLTNYTRWLCGEEIRRRKRQNRIPNRKLQDNIGFDTKYLEDLFFILEGLEPEEKSLLIDKFIGGKTYEELAIDYNEKKEKVCRRIKNTLNKCRNMGI